MPKLKAGTILPTPAEDAAIQAASLSDLDSAPLTDTQWEQVKPLVRRGRPLGSGTKTQVTLRLDVEVVEKFRATGDGWQTRINDALKSWVKRHAGNEGQIPIESPRPLSKTIRQRVAPLPPSSSTARIPARAQPLATHGQAPAQAGE